MDIVQTLKKSRGQIFVEYVLDRIKNDNAFGAALRRVDNTATESQSWEYLVHWCDLDNARERRSFAAIAAAIARVKPERDGYLGIGKAIYFLFRLSVEL